MTCFSTNQSFKPDMAHTCSFLCSVHVDPLFYQRLCHPKLCAVSLLLLRCFPLFFFSWLMTTTQPRVEITVFSKNIKDKCWMLRRPIQVNGAFYSIKKSHVINTVIVTTMTKNTEWAQYESWMLGKCPKWCTRHSEHFRLVGWCNYWNSQRFEHS